MTMLMVVLALMVIAWLAFDIALVSDGFSAGFVAGGTLIGTVIYLWAWAQRQDLLDAQRFEDQP